ncbi:MAG: PH domain-containing protein [Actinomycetales bacterium]
MEPFDPADVTWQRVSPRLAAARRLALSVQMLVLVAIPIVLVVLGVPAWALVAVPVLLGFFAWAWWVVGRQVGAIGYAEREDDLLVRRGILIRALVVVPYGRMQYVDVQAGPIDRRFGIARVQLHTASPGTDAQIPGLPPDEAARLRDRLARRGEARLAGL